MEYEDPYAALREIEKLADQYIKGVGKAGWTIGTISAIATTARVCKPEKQEAA